MKAVLFNHHIKINPAINYLCTSYAEQSRYCS